MIRDRVNQFIEDHFHGEKIYRQCKEVEWANIFHDSIKGRKWLENLPIYPGRWAVNYSFLYILSRILVEYRPEKIIEFGLGESSKIISSFIENEASSSRHIILEQNRGWIDSFTARFTLSKKSTILHMAVEEEIIHKEKVNCYKGLTDAVAEVFDLYVIDGPLGSHRYSRYDVCKLAKLLNPADEFVVIMDDYNRIGEQDTAKALIEIVHNKGIKTYSGIYEGNKSQIVLVTEKYRYLTSF